MIQLNEMSRTGKSTEVASRLAEGGSGEPANGDRRAFAGEMEMFWS